MPPESFQLLMINWSREMRYPTIAEGKVDELVVQLINGGDVSVEANWIWRGDGESIDFAPLESIIETLMESLDQSGSDPDLTADKEPFEGEVAVNIYPFLASIPVEVKDDPGFWRFLAVRYFWWFIAWREAESIRRGNVGTYTSGRINTESIPLRLYLRAKSVDLGGDVVPAQQLIACTDFWRSHVTRVRTGTSPIVTRAFVEMQAGEGHLATNPLREYARRLNRSWTNVLLSLYSQDRAAALIQELRD